MWARYLLYGLLAGQVGLIMKKYMGSDAKEISDLVVVVISPRYVYYLDYVLSSRCKTIAP